MSARRKPIEERRARLGDAAIYSVRQAAELLPWETSDAVQWLHRMGLVRVVAGGREVVSWREVLAQVEAAGRPAASLPGCGLRPRQR